MKKACAFVIITGAGRAFCSGGDVVDIIGELTGRDAEGLLQFTRLTCELIRNMRALPKPIIASLNGPLLEPALASRSLLTFASRLKKQRSLSSSSKSDSPELTWGATYLLPRVVGLAKATELLMTGDFVEAAEAAALGLYNRVVPREQLEAATHEFAQSWRMGRLWGIAKQRNAESRNAHGI
jgi:enoyl-CoA hydratase/carnithine racemase